MRKLGIDSVETEAVDEGVGRKVVQGEKLEFVQYSYEGGSTFPVHHHPAEQITIVVRGQLNLRGPEGRPSKGLTVSPGELVIIPPNQPHGASIPSDCEKTVTYNFFSGIREGIPGNDSG